MPIHNGKEVLLPTKETKLQDRSAYLQTMIALASAAFGVVAALAWNGAISALFKQIFGTSAQIVSLFIYAIIVTIIAVIVMVQLANMAARYAPPQA